MEAFRVKSDSYRAKLEAAEMEKVKTSRAETLRALLSFRRDHDIHVYCPSATIDDRHR